MRNLTGLIAGLASLVMLSACLFEPLPFDQEKWLESVEETDTDDLYADNYRNGRYLNPWMPQKDKSFARFLRWQLSQTKEYSQAARENRPAYIPELATRIEALPEDIDFITWIGHATFLFRIGGEYWLTDPMFSQRALLPKRISQPAMDTRDLAKLQAKINVVISHNHYDHLDKSSISNLPPDSRIYVPLGLGEYVASFAPGPVIEMNWWQTTDTGPSTELTCLPMQHWSRRVFQGYNETLWASFMIKSGERVVYFGGDSGYFKGYREIGRVFQNIDYAILPITAYHPRWFMHYSHMNTREAIMAFEDLGASYFIPSQWGTFHLGDNPPGLPPLDLQRDIGEMDKDPARFLLLNLGEIRIL